jgi:chromosome segregation ATPase
MDFVKTCLFQGVTVPTPATAEQQNAQFYIMLALVVVSSLVSAYAVFVATKKTKAEAGKTSQEGNVAMADAAQKFATTAGNLLDDQQELHARELTAAVNQEKAKYEWRIMELSGRMQSMEDALKALRNDGEIKDRLLAEREVALHNASEKAVSLGNDNASLKAELDQANLKIDELTEVVRIQGETITSLKAEIDALRLELTHKGE